jgi:hypothetical protein
MGGERSEEHEREQGEAWDGDGQTILLMAL